MNYVNKQQQPAKKPNGSLYAGQGLSPQQNTLSEIAARLRLVHGQMQQDPRESGASLQQNHALSAHLTEMSRALLAEHHDRRAWQKKLLERLEQIEQLQKTAAEKQVQQMSALELAKIEEIIEKAALKTQHNLKSAWEEQAKQFKSQQQANAYQEQIKQADVRETESQQISKTQSLEQEEKPQGHGNQQRFSMQFLALQEQISHIQQKLNESDIKQERSIIYQVADYPINHMSDVFRPKAKNAQRRIILKNTIKSFFAFTPVKFIATLLALLTLYGFYLQFTSILHDISSLQF